MTPLPGHSASILIADDDPLIRLVLRHASERHGYQVIEVSNGSDLLERVAASSFKLCIMDASMPGPSVGVRLTTMRSVAPAMEVLIISGYAEQPESARGSGARFMSKPIELASFDKLLDGLRPSPSLGSAKA
ncbi:MAG: response regulator containing CheY-like receiver [Homoserinimonas sp.]|jgi:two-component system cell cycle sensor histidine kinase/response regulator CckA|nr:response regulator containing CheY-like receiver [Homoserinimonas sp.]